VNALANEEVGSFLDAHFVSAFHKVGSFTIVGEQKVGGNVASYFCTPDGRVLHCVPGPVDAATLLAEARWVVETGRQALWAGGGYPSQFRGYFQKAHAERLRLEHGLDLDPSRPHDGRHFRLAADRSGEIKHLGSAQARTHLLLALYPLAGIDQVYQVIFTGFLHEPISNQPVRQLGSWD
jgi:hypothetical protein